MLTNRFQPGAGVETGRTGRNSYSYLNGVDETPPHASGGGFGSAPAAPAPFTAPAYPEQQSSRNNNFKQGSSEGAGGGGGLGSMFGAAKSVFNDVKGGVEDAAPEVEGAAESVAPELAAGGGADAGLLILAA